MSTKPGHPTVEPTLAITSPCDGDTVMPDFSATGSYSQWNGSGLQISCSIQNLSDPNCAPLNVVATFAPNSPGSTSGTWEALFTAVPPGTYSLNCSFPEPDQDTR